MEAVDLEVAGAASPAAVAEEAVATPVVAILAEEVEDAINVKTETNHNNRRLSAPSVTHTTC